MAPQTFKAAIFRGVGSIDVVDLPYPPCGDDEAIVRNVLTGICGSDISAFHKHTPESRIWIDEEFGHEAISEVVELGKNVTGLAIGDRVFVNQDRAFRDARRISATGGFSNYLRIPQCEVGYSLLPIDNDLPTRTAVLFEPFVIGARAVQGLLPQAGDTAIVFGAGIIGMTSAIMLDWLGCKKVMVVDYSDFRLENARRLGFLTCNPRREDLKAKAIAEFGTQRGYPSEKCGAQLYVDCVGVPSVIHDFAALARPGASMSIVGVHKEATSLNFTEIAFNNWQIRGCGSETTENLLPVILEMMRSRRYDLSSLVTHEFPVDQISEAIALAAKPDEAQKVCISF
ncbi:zinc-dependent alcohol dehydrogenase [Novosphingobium sp. JCM 18896]|uniref:zinc-dependent alcohol dehydrogenase n=1 Tax=Novosphingobium sp. JCM 18896 TaxID=2989731 RepID=UPI00222342AC|nr:zinc-binding dehydrogenase [Novosphingobium sp. JCM 18896]MCW1431646.1 zinc-binding dehydrogenase [Novosphingobium sp. JCM 18896]